MATWAFCDGNHFDLVALPRPADGDKAGIVAKHVDVRPNPTRSLLPLVILLVILAGVAVGLALHRGEGVAVPPPPFPSSPSPTRTPASKVDRSPPDPSQYRDDSTDSDERLRVVEGLVGLAERFGVLEAEAAARAPNRRM